MTPEMATDGWVSVDGLRIHYLAAGEGGSTVLLLHGGGLDSAALSFRYAIGALAPHFRVIAPDWPGYGESDKPDIPYSNAYNVDFLGRLLDALELEKASLVGISMGGGAALGFALRSPERVDQLVLADSYGLGGEIPFGTLAYLSVNVPVLAEASWAILSNSRDMVRWSLQAIFYDPYLVTEHLVDEVFELLSKPGVGRAFRSFQRNEGTWDGLRTDYSDRLSQIVVPTLIVHGAQDALVPVEWAKRAHNSIPGSRLHIIARCGHWPMRERPEEFNQAVSSFLLTARGDARRSP